MISDDTRDYGKFTDGPTCNPEKGVSELFPEVAMGCINAGGSTLKVIRLIQLQACPKKL
jgi:hypothetical protein